MTFTQKMFSFQGRLRRRDFWLMVAVQWGVLIAYWLFIAIVAIALGAGSTMQGQARGPILVFYVVNSILSLGLVASLVWVGLAIQVKRCHDRNQSGWFVLFGLIPFFSLINLGILDGTAGPNRFGPSPKNIDANAEVFA
jgi:uncharacterized membrane protein YhaH (DUF805 family)